MACGSSTKKASSAYQRRTRCRLAPSRVIGRQVVQVRARRPGQSRAATRVRRGADRRVTQARAATGSAVLSAHAPGPSRRRPRTQAARTMSGMRPEDEPAGEVGGVVVGRRPAIGATNAGSIAMTSASLPASSEPMPSSSPSACAPPSVPSRSQSSGSSDRRRLRRRPLAARSGRRSRPASRVKIERSGPAGHVRARGRPTGPASR